MGGTGEMITYLFALVIIILSILYVLLTQCFIYSLTVSLYYAFCMLIVCLYFQRLIKRKQDKIMADLIKLLDKSDYTPNYSDNSLSTIEHKLYTLVQKNNEIKVRISEEKERMNGLISDVSHQIKTPLSNIIMYSDLLLEDKRFDYVYAERIRNQAEKLRFLFDALIKMSRCENGIIIGSIHPKENNIKELIAKAASDIYAAAEERNIIICTSCDAALSAYFDMIWTVEALVNILENAIKYTANHNRIQINAEKYQLFIRINIIDTGTGISEDEKQNIWKRFYRGDNADNEKGVGIGLYLVQQILSSEHGYAKVESKLGVGSTFSIFLPINKAD